MRRSKVISISVCATFFIVSTLILFVVCYLSKATPNMNDELFVPVSVKEVPEEQDIAVQIHPISVVDQTLREKCEGEFRLSDIQKGWMTTLELNIFTFDNADIITASNCDSEVPLQDP